MKLVVELARPGRRERKDGAEDLGAAAARPHEDRTVPACPHRIRADQDRLAPELDPVFAAGVV